MNTPTAFSISDFCKHFSIGRTKAYEEIRAGRLKMIKCGRRTLITRIAAEGWLDLLEHEADNRIAATER